jgi:hypothetical protein
MNGNDFLPRGSEGAAKTAIIEFVESVTEPGGSYVPPAERFATFDNDGTLWCEKPLYLQADFVFRRWKAMGETDRPRRTNSPVRRSARMTGPGSQTCSTSAGAAQGRHRSVRGNHGRGVRAGRAAVLRDRDPADAGLAGHQGRLPADARAARPTRSPRRHDLHLLRGRTRLYAPGLRADVRHLRTFTATASPSRSSSLLSTFWLDWCS